jgi:murein DD-endopeptidase MepM/ murein hydrolase activator NlpD
LSVKKKSLYEWFSTRVTLNIRNEENYALKKSIRFSYAQAFVLGSTFFVLFSIFTLWIATKVVGIWYNPREDYFNTKKKVIKLAMSVDSLEEQIRQKDLFISHVRNIIETGEVEEVNQKQPTEVIHVDKKTENIDLDYLPEIDSVFRNQFEASNVLSSISNDDRLGLRVPTFLTPVDGFLLEKFDLKSKKYGVKIGFAASVPVVNVFDGVVVFSNWNLKDGYVLGIQHVNNVVSVYKQKTSFIKSVGTWVKEGDILALSNPNSSSELGFEIWHKGEALNPSELINF